MAEYQAYTDLKIGANVGALTSLTLVEYSGSNAGIPPPKTAFREAVQISQLANGHLKMLGPVVIVWRFTNLTLTARKGLRQFITAGMSEALAIASPDENGDMQNWLCVMQWPEREPAYLSFRMIDELEITFVDCIQQ